jgi:hypothetical protein
MGTPHNYELIQPVHENFRELSIDEAFTWEDGITETDEHGLYVVSFTSQRNLNADPKLVGRLLELDNGAFEEAIVSPGFGTYWHDDELAKDGSGLSFCAWGSQANAKAAAALPNHREAVKFALGEGKDVYKHYGVDMHTVHMELGSLVFRAVNIPHHVSVLASR